METKYSLIGILEVDNEPFEFPKGIRDYYFWMKVNDKGTYLSRSIYTTDVYPEDPEFLFERFGGNDLEFFENRFPKDSTEFRELFNDYCKLFVKTDVNHGSYFHRVIESRVNVRVRLKGQKDWIENEKLS